MYGKKLTDTEVAERMVELRNLRRLHQQDQVIKATLRAEVKELRKENAELKQTVATLQIQIAELQTMVFGKKKKPPMGGGTVVLPLQPTIPKKVRSKDSYRRSLPPASAITAEVVVPLPEVCACGGSFDPSIITTHDRYEEDIPLPELTPNYQAQLVTKYVISKGRCKTCGQSTTGTNPATSKPYGLGGAQVSLGPNVRLLVIHLIATVGISYSQVHKLLLSLYGLVVSDGEIANILTKQHQNWLPAYNQLKADIQAAPVRHYDETPWKIQATDNAGYAWVMSATDSPKTLFHLATSRGASHAKRLHGEVNTTTPEAIHISDDYSAYRNLSGQQQLCWAHLYRTIRDLRYNTNLPTNQLTYVRQWYQSFATIYQDLRQCLEEPYNPVTRQTQSQELWQRVQALANQPVPKKGQPDKLRRLKAQLLRAGQDRLFVCLPKDAPCDNNRAERDLRQLVLKRKRSFGSKTEKGAQALATILSICTTTWRTNPNSYFTSLATLG